MNIRKTTLARNYAEIIAKGTLPLKRAVIISLKTYDLRFQHRVQTYVWAFIQDQLHAKHARN